MVENFEVIFLIDGGGNMKGLGKLRAFSFLVLEIIHSPTSTSRWHKRT